MGLAPGLLRLQRSAAWHRGYRSPSAAQAHLPPSHTPCPRASRSWSQHEIFDAQLTSTGEAQARALNAKLLSPKGLQAMLPAGQTLKVVTSPLSRTIQTAATVFANTTVGKVVASELCRGKIGKYSSGQRRSVLPAAHSSTELQSYEPPQPQPPSHRRHVKKQKGGAEL